jgi:hypothetical protein
MAFFDSIGHSRPNSAVRVMFGSPLTATEEPTFRFGGFVPDTDIATAQVSRQIHDEVKIV